MNSWMVVVGATMIGFQIPEFMAAIAKVRIPIIVNIWWAIALCLLSSGIVYG